MDGRRAIVSTSITFEAVFAPASTDRAAQAITSTPAIWVIIRSASFKNCS